MGRLVLAGGLVLLLVLPGGALARHHPHHRHHPPSAPTVAMFTPGQSGIQGSVTLRRLRSGGTAIAVAAQGLQPGTQYKSLTYANATCAFEPYAADDVIGGGPYTADAGGDGTTQGAVADGLGQIGSVSVRLASDFSLLACAPIPAAR